MKEICTNCSTEKLCPQCNHDIFNRPLSIKYIDKEMPIIIHTCFICCVELFRSMTFESKNHHKNYCIKCAMELETEAWKYRELSK